MIEKTLEKHYLIFDLTQDAKFSEVKLAYRDLIIIWHPDRFVNNKRIYHRAEKKLVEINESYAFIKRINEIAIKEEQEILNNKEHLKSQTERGKWSDKNNNDNDSDKNNNNFHSEKEAQDNNYKSNIIDNFKGKDKKTIRFSLWLLILVCFYPVITWFNRSDMLISLYLANAIFIFLGFILKSFVYSEKWD